MADVAYIPGEPGQERRPAIGYAMVISAALLFALNGTVSKVVLQSGVSPLELTQVRATGAFLGFAIVLAFARRDSLRLTRRQVPYLVAVNCFAGFHVYAPHEVRAALDLDADTPVVLCDAREKGSWLPSAWTVSSEVRKMAIE